MRPLKQSKQLIRWASLSALAGVLAGAGAALFLHLLEWATQTRGLHPEWVWFLPIAGLGIGLIYHRYGKGTERGQNLILDEIHDPRSVLPFRMAPLVLVGTVLTHLFGGSAGREGTAVQMGASLADQLSRFFRVENGERKILLVAGAGAGFGAAIGAPFAGALFGMEVIYVSGLRLFAVVECFIASFAGYCACVLLRAPHSRYPSIVIPEFDLKVLASVGVAGVAFGLAALSFVALVHSIELAYSRLSIHPMIRPLIGGVLLVALYRMLGTDRYEGLGISVIQEALVHPVLFADSAWKALATALTVGSGFKGGEFIPLVFIGSTLGSALSWVLPASAQLLAGVGFAAVFAGASNTPIACTVMAIEIFGWAIAPYALVACLVSYACSGHRGIYRAQVLEQSKHRHFFGVLSWAGGLPSRFLNRG